MVPGRKSFDEMLAAARVWHGPLLCSICKSVQVSFRSDYYILQRLPTQQKFTLKGLLAQKACLLEVRVERLLGRVEQLQTNHVRTGDLVLQRL